MTDEMRLHVAMQHLLAVGDMQCHRHSHTAVEQVLGRQRAVLGEQVAQVPVVQLHDDARSIVGGERRSIHTNDVGMVELTEGAAFAFEHRPIAIGRETGIEHLDGDRAVQRNLMGAIDDRKPTRPDSCQVGITLDRHRWRRRHLGA
jgi:hypothetical protein